MRRSFSIFAAMLSLSNPPLTLVGETSFKHYDCVVNGSLYVDNVSRPLFIVIVPHTNQDELGSQITFSKISKQWLTEYSLPVLHSDTYKSIVETVMEYIAG